MRYLKSVFLFFFLFSCSVAIADELSDLQAKAESGDADAQYQLGTLYYDKGYNKDITEDFINAGVSEDYKQAAHWYLKAAEQGHAGAQSSLGRLYSIGFGVTEDDKQAAHWYLKAAEQGHAEAQNSLGIAYEFGDGVEEDDKQAAHWYLKAAEQGDDGGQHLLGTLYYNGEGVPQDFKQAEHWFLKAAEQGDDAYSAGYLGDMYIEQQVSNKTIKKPNIGV